MSPARLVVCGLEFLVVVDSVVIPESDSAVVEIDGASSSTVIDTEMDAGDVEVSLCSSDIDIDEDEEEDKESRAEGLEVEIVEIIVVEERTVVSSAPTAVATSPFRAGKIDKSLSAHATNTS
jgi:hypothetical protein